MASQRRQQEEGGRRRRPATTPEGRESQLVSKAMDLAERQLESGDASSQVITHFLKAGSSREKLEQQRIAHENELTLAKIEAMASAQRIEEMYDKALSAMGVYSGKQPKEDDYDEDQDLF